MPNKLIIVKLSIFRKPSFDEHDDLLDQVEVCSILFHADELWVGTVDGEEGVHFGIILFQAI